MKKQVYIIHGWGGCPAEGWFPWLKKELEAKGFEVTVPAMPEADTPRIHNWVPAISKLVKNPDKNIFLVGHSMGNQAICRYLETLPAGTEIGGAVFVAGFLNRLTGIETPNEQEIADHWLKAPINLSKIKLRLPKSVAIFSDNDEFVPLDSQNEFKSGLGSEIIVLHNKEHFSGGDGINELPEALEAVLKISA